MSDLGQCEYSVKRGQKLLRCQSRARQTVDIEGEVLPLCPAHAAVVTRLLARKAKLEKYYEEVTQQIAIEKQKIIDPWRELKRGF